MKSTVGGFAAFLVGAALSVFGVMPALGATGITHEAVLATGGTTATVTVHGGAVAAGNRMSVLILDEDANFSAPAKGDIVYLNELTLDGGGNATITVALPTSDLDAYAIAMNAGSGRYLTSLDPAGSLPGSGGETPGPGPGGGSNGGNNGGGSGGSGTGGGSGSGSSTVQNGVAAGPTPSPTASGTPAHPTPAPSTTPAAPADTDSAVAAPSSTEQGSGAAPWIIAGAVLLLTVVAAGIWVFRRRTSPSE